MNVTIKRALALAILFTASAGGQCAMCYRNAQALGVARGHVFNSGIVILGAPPLLLVGGFVFLIRRRRHGSE